eukprot:TRINITY_DN1570_c0_g1_i1.p1 TRINITY_DN1570_c0_g1~~TRINITY_DN1570_c0_g1_i1.p1  ORF type:complete len:112 (+),score=22.40 TRINITY_DN1570_c0_g1_i1:156-491(+)
MAELFRKVAAYSSAVLIPVSIAAGIMFFTNETGTVHGRRLPPPEKLIQMRGEKRAKQIHENNVVAMMHIRQAAGLSPLPEDDQGDHKNDERTKYNKKSNSNYTGKGQSDQH